MKLVTEFSKNATHVLLVRTVGIKQWTTLRKINENGFNVYEDPLGDIVCSIPDWRSISGYKNQTYWPVYGFFSKEEGEIVQRGVEQNATLNGKSVMRNLRADEKVVKLAA
jgi:hypothetical protein